MLRGTAFRSPYTAGLPAFLLVATLALSGCGTTTTELPAQGVLPAPTGLRVESLSSGVRLSWDPVAGALFYRIYWALGATVSRASGTLLRSSDTTFLQSGLAGGETYAYLVTAVDSKGHEGEPSAVVTTALGPTPLDAPQNVRATAGDAQVTIEWDPVPNASGYRIEVDSSLASFTATNHPAPPFVHQKALNRTTYTYTVRATFGKQVGPASLPVEATPMPTKPGIPVFIDVQVQTVAGFDDGGGVTRHGVIRLEWTKADHATNYQVYAKREQGPEIPLIPQDRPLTETKFNHGLDEGDYEKVYEYRVEAFNDGVPSGLSNPQAPPARASVPTPLQNGESYTYVMWTADAVTELAASNEASATPVENIFLIAPTSVTAFDTPRDFGNSLTVRWNPSHTRGVTSQGLYRSSTGDPGSYELLETFPDNTTSAFEDHTVTDGTQYFYALKAFSLDLESGLSEAASGISATNSSLTPPTDLSVSDTPDDTGDSLTLTWSPSTARDVDGQRLYRSTSDGGPYNIVTTLSDPLRNRFDDGPVIAGTVYYYTVHALIGAQESAPSNQGAGTAEVNHEPFPPRGLLAVDTPRDFGGAVELSWTPSVSPAATEQRLYRSDFLGGPSRLVAAFRDRSTDHYSDSGVPSGPCPTGLTVIATVVADGSSALLITWSPVAKAIDGYRLYWWEENSAGEIVASDTVDDIVTERFVHSGLTSGSRYLYAMQVQGYPALSFPVEATAP